MAKFDYTYDAAGNILTWRQQADSTAVMWEYGYDSADQLTTAVKKTTDPTPAILQRLVSTYDSTGNRTAEQIDDAVTTSTYDSMNRSLSQVAGGMLRFEGTLNEPATVTVGGQQAAVTADNRFTARKSAPARRRLRFELRIPTGTSGRTPTRSASQAFRRPSHTMQTAI